MEKSYDASRRRLLKGGLGAVFSPLVTAGGLPMPMSIAANAAPPVVAAAMVPHHLLFVSLLSMQATSVLQLYPWHIAKDRPGQGVLSNIKRAPLVEDVTDEPVAEVKAILQQAVQFISNEQKNMPLDQRDYLAEVRHGLPRSIASIFRERVLGLLFVYGQSPAMLRDYTNLVRKDKNCKERIEALYGTEINHKGIRARVMQHIDMMMALFDAVDQMMPGNGTGASLSALDGVVSELLSNSAEVAIRLKGDLLSAEEKKAAFANVPTETAQVLARLSEHDKVMLVLQSSLFLPTKGPMPADLQNAIIRGDSSHIRNKMTDDLAWLRTRSAQPALSSLRQDVESFFAQRARAWQAGFGINDMPASSSLSSLMNVTTNTLRSAAAGLASLFKQGAEISGDRKSTPAQPQAQPPQALPYQPSDMLPPQMRVEEKQPVPRSKDAPGPQ